MGVAAADAQRVNESIAEREARLARRGVGLRVGTWDIDVSQSDTTELSSSLQYELFYQRGLGDHLAIENSVAVWRRVTEEVQTLPLGGDRVVEVKSHIVPLLTSLKFYPVTKPANLFEPYLATGVGIALGIVTEAENAIGGGGTTITTGFALRAGVGLDVHLTNTLGILAAGRYQWSRFSDDLGSQNVFNGAGFDGGVTYRFQF